MKKILARLSIPEEGLEFPGKTLFRGGLEFEWAAGRHWGVVGPNGSGKSVFLSLLASSRYHQNAETEYFFDGKGGTDPVRDICVVSPEKHAATMAEIGAYAEMRWNAADEETAPTLDSWLSRDAAEGREKWEVRPLDPAGDRRFLARRAALAGALGIAPLMSRRIAALSNGEMRRALLCRALLARPVLLMLDAPTVGLDGQSRDALFSALAKLFEKRGGPAIAFATVRAAELPRGVTDMLVLDAAGAVAYCGPASGAPFPIGQRLECTAGAGPAVAAAGAAAARRTATTWEVSEVPHPGRGGAARAGTAQKGRPLIEMRGVSVKYGDAEIFRDLDWTVRQGEKWLVAGPNGCGKSTILALVAGDHQQAYSECVRFFGRRRGTGESVWDVKRRIGWVSPEQQSCIDGSIRVLDAVLSGLDDSAVALRKATKPRVAKAMAALRSVCPGVSPQARFSSLSCGTARLVLLARAIVKNPPLLVLDEPCQNLDAENRKRFLAVIDSLCASGERTLVFVAHLSDSVPRCIDHVLRARRETR
ncbi:MAG: ATP-binding cassette domain-containing protein [Kiritimatiellae bacterium]|nr:ATP-binding cassette domain-containing protein [Kiritimatiellia bacterium]